MIYDLWTNYGKQIQMIMAESCIILNGNSGLFILYFEENKKTCLNSTSWWKIKS